MSLRLPLVSRLSAPAREFLGGGASFVVCLVPLAQTSRILGHVTHEAPDLASFCLAVLLVAGARLLALLVATTIAGERAASANRFLAKCLIATSALTLLHTHAWASGWLALLVLPAGIVLLCGPGSRARVRQEPPRQRTNTKHGLEPNT